MRSKGREGGDAGASEVLPCIYGLLCPTWEPASCQSDEICLRLISSEGSDYVSLPVSFCLLIPFTVAHTQTVLSEVYIAPSIFRSLSASMLHVHLLLVCCVTAVVRVCTLQVPSSTCFSMFSTY